MERRIVKMRKTMRWNDDSGDGVDSTKPYASLPGRSIMNEQQKDDDKFICQYTGFCNYATQGRVLLLLAVLSINWAGGR